MSHPKGDVVRAAAFIPYLESTNPEPGHGDLRGMYRDQALDRAPRGMAEHKDSFGQELKFATFER